MQIETDIADRRLAQRRQVSDFQHDIPGVLCFSGKRWLSVRPTMAAIMLSIVSPSRGCVEIHWPSRRMVISSQRRKISSILWEI